MKYLFSESGMKILESYCFTKTLFSFDFDGTLAKIVSAPEDARLSEETSSLLKSLNEVVPVAIISGRGKSDLISRLTFMPQFIIGNHGLEGMTASSFAESDLKALCQSWKLQLHEKLPPSLFADGVELEDKGLSLAIHYRKCRQRKLPRSVIAQTIETLNPSPRVILGKSVFNLVPPGGPHKGIALMELMNQAGIRSAFYIGDDDTDEDVFALLNVPVMTVRVGQKRNSQAKFFIQRQPEVNRLLRVLLEFIERNKNLSASSSL